MKIKLEGFKSSENRILREGSLEYFISWRVTSFGLYFKRFLYDRRFVFPVIERRQG